MGDTVVFGVGQEDYRQAEWLADQFEGRWRYDFTAKQWHGWNGTRWAVDKTEQIKREVAELAATHVITSQSEQERKALLKLLSLAPIDKALEALATLEGYGTDGSDWDQVPYLLGCNNGIIDLRANALVENPTPDMLVTLSTGHDFHPFEGGGFTAWAKRAPEFTRFLRQITSVDDEEDPQMAAFLLLWFGYSLFGSTPEQRYLLMTGVGRNGKGVLKNSVLHAVGEYGAQPDANVYMRSKFGAPRSDGARADLMALKGKRVGFFSEPEGGRFNEELLKAHTGGDLITARALYSNNVVSWEPTHSITFLVNDAPSLDDVGPSMGDRTMVANFTNRYEGARQDRKLGEKLEKEAEGILALLVWAASVWQSDGLAIPERVIEQSKAFMERNDPIAHALEEAFDVGVGLQAQAKLLYEAYVQWHTRSGQEGEAMSTVKFAWALDKKGFKKKTVMQGTFWMGLKPKSAVDVARGGADDD